MHSILLAFLFILSPAFAHAEHTSEWNYVDVRWPQHIGPLIDEADPDGYIHQVIGKESKRINGWSGRQGSLALDTVTACGLHFDGYLRQRHQGTYVILVITSADKQEHRLKWIPVEYRFDNGSVQYFSRRDGSSSDDEVQKSLLPGASSQDYQGRGGKPNVKANPELYPEYHKYLFDNGSPKHEYRTRGVVTISPKFKYLEVVKFADPKELTTHDWMQIYLPWIDECETKPDLEFKRDHRQEVVWDDHMRGWISAGMGIAALEQAGWQAVRPSPSYYLRVAYMGWGHQGFTHEDHVAVLHNVSSSSATSIGYLSRTSYAYAVWLGKYLTLSPEVGVRGVLTGGTIIPGVGGGLNLAWEVPRTRHQTNGQRLMFEGGCDLERTYGGLVSGNSLGGLWGNCKIGFGLGW